MIASKSWKDFLLSSGLPLEYGVREILKEFDIFSPSEYTYERFNEYGVPVLFSVDIASSKLLGKNNISIELIIECKYRHDSTKWIFIPEDYGRHIEFSDTFIAIDDLVKDFKINKDKLNSYANLYCLCSKGMEILPDKSNPKSIKGAVQQLKFAVVNKVIDTMEAQAFGLGNENTIYVILPIIVTTADLWLLNSGISIENIKNENDIENIATKKDLLIMHEMPDRELKRYTKSKLTDGFDENVIDYIRQQFDNDYDFDVFVEIFATFTPSKYLIINYSRFKSSITNLLSFLEIEDIIKKS